MFASLAVCAMLLGCGGSGSSGESPADSPIPIVTSDPGALDASGIGFRQGNFDPVATLGARGGFWASCSHVSLYAGGIKLIETGLASGPDAGDSCGSGVLPWNF